MWYQPSRNALAVASGWCQYSTMKLPPRAQTSPAWPRGHDPADLVPDRELDAGHGPAGTGQEVAAPAVLLGPEQGQDGAALGHAVALPQFDVGVEPEHPVEQVAGHGRGAVDELAEAGQPLGPEVRMGQVSPIMVGTMTVSVGR